MLMKEQKGLKLALLFFIILTLGLGGYIIYDKVLHPTKDSTNEKLDDKEETEESKEEPKKEDKKLYDEYLIMHIPDHFDILVGRQNNMYYELYSFEGEKYNVEPIGMYSNKIYLKIKGTVLYMDIYGENQLKPVSWFNHSKARITDDATLRGSNLIFRFEGQTNSSELDGILSLSVHAKYLTQAKQLVPYNTYGEFVMDEEQENIYFLFKNESNSKYLDLAVYNFEKESIEVIAKSVLNMDIIYGNGYIAFYRESDSSNRDAYRVYIYDTRTKKTILVSDYQRLGSQIGFFGNQFFYADADFIGHLYNIDTGKETNLGDYNDIDLYDGKIYIYQSYDEREKEKKIENDYIIYGVPDKESIGVILADNTIVKVNPHGIYPIKEN